MSDHERNAKFLAKRLASMGIEVKCAVGEQSATGMLTLSSTPFESLDGSFVIATGSFYTLGHNRLKFSQPRALFDLPPLEIGRCDCADDIEAALRRAWSKHVRALKQARGWLEQLGAVNRSVSGGTRLMVELDPQRLPAAFVRSRDEILLPSSGALANRSPEEPAERRFRPLRSLEHSSELILAIEREMARVGAIGEQPEGGPPPAFDDYTEVARRTPRVLVLDHVLGNLDAMESGLRDSGFRVEGFQDPGSALQAFERSSFDLVVAGAHLPRMDGLEFTARVQELPGIEQQPVLILDDRETESTRLAATEAGASGYLVRPRSWLQASRDLQNLLETLSSRRFHRYAARLPVAPLNARAPDTEVTRLIGRGGFSLITRREPRLGETIRYRVRLPRPLPTIEIDGITVFVRAELGQASVTIGVEFAEFHGNSEHHWVRLIEALASRESRKA